MTKPLMLVKSAARRVRNAVRDREWRLLFPVSKDSIRDRWSVPDNLMPEWDERTEIIAGLIPPGSRVVEFGAGRLVMKGLLAGKSDYVPSDIVARSDDTIVCDLNSSLPDLPGDFTHAVFSGVLEYVEPVDALVKYLAQKVDFVIASYATLEAVPSLFERRRNGWIGNLTAQEFVDLFRTNGFAVVSSQTWGQQTIFMFRNTMRSA